MKRSVSLAVLAAALFAVLAGPGVAAACSKAITLTAHSKLDHAAAVEAPPVGRSAGDEVIFTETLFNNAGRRIGSDAATCTYLFDQRSLCRGAYILRRGQLQTQLIQPNLSGTRIYDQAIIGGTGRYAGAWGTITVHQHTTGGDTLVFRIRLPAD
jgi:hypothetical protein